MSVTRENVVNELLDIYTSNYDITRYEEDQKPTELPLEAFCRFAMHTEKYVINRKAQLWEMNGNEYAYVFSVPMLDEEMFARCRDYAYEEGMKLVQPGPGHMYSYITTVFICDSCTEEARRLVKKCRIKKSFHFSLHGWMDFHTVLIDLEKKQADHNSGGRESAKIMKKYILNKKGRRL